MQNPGPASQIFNNILRANKPSSYFETYTVSVKHMRVYTLLYMPIYLGYICMICIICFYVHMYVRTYACPQFG